VKGLDRDFLTIEKRFENEGYGFLTIALPALCDSFDKGIATGEFTCIPNFKTVKNGTIPAFMQGMFCEVFDPLTGLLKENPNIGVVKLIRNVLRLFKKTQLGDDANEQLDVKAKVEFFRTDEIARQVILPDREDHLIGIVCKMLLPTLYSKSIENANYKHGPGAVFEGLKGNQKWSSLVDAIMSDSFDTQTFGYCDFSSSLALPSARSDVTESSVELCLKDRASRRIARLITVAKNSTSRRTITVEPMLNQFIQQGLNILLRDSILECKILRNSLALTDQSKNQQLALEGSLYDNWATIDLKSASDLLSVSLVRSVFRHHDSFLNHMMSCRSTSVHSGSDTINDLGKFAGMGNALTFPVQSICFTVVGIASILDSWGLKPNYRNVMRASRCIRVYGDDIIIKREYAHRCVDWLHNVGLKVNVAKSFLEGNFKESCGVDAFMGVDVTPIYLRYRPDLITTEPKVIAALVSTANQMWLDGLYSCSATLSDEVERRLGKRLPLVTQESGTLGWHTRLDGANPHRWNSTLHRFETRSFALAPLKRKDKLDGYAALLKFFHVPLLGRMVGHLKESSIRYKSRIVSRWVPT
jgi:hypothetical protein